MMIFGNITNTTRQFRFKIRNLFFSFKKKTGNLPIHGNSRRICFGVQFVRNCAAHENLYAPLL